MQLTVQQMRKHKTRPIDRSIRLEHEKKKLEARSLADQARLESVCEEMEDMEDMSEDSEPRRSVKSTRARMTPVRSEQAVTRRSKDVLGSMPKPIFMSNIAPPGKFHHSPPKVNTFAAKEAKPAL